MPLENWRKDAGLVCTPVYHHRFAFLPTKCENGLTVFFEWYYRKFNVWEYDRNSPHRRSDKESDIPTYQSVEFVENVTKEEYLIRKLSGNL